MYEVDPEPDWLTRVAPGKQPVLSQDSLNMAVRVSMIVWCAGWLCPPRGIGESYQVLPRKTRAGAGNVRPLGIIVKIENQENGLPRVDKALRTFSIWLPVVMTALDSECFTLKGISSASFNTYWTSGYFCSASDAEAGMAQASWLQALTQAT